MTTDFSSILDQVRIVAQEAAAWVREHRPEGRVDVADTKSSPTDVVTELDRACEARIREGIADLWPQDGFVGEEFDPVAGTSGVVWVVDPIDGTVNFVYGIAGYAISIAAEYHGEAVLGYVFDIATGTEYGALRGGGAWRWDGSEKRTLSGPPPMPVAEMLVATGFNYRPELRKKQGEAVARLLPHIRDIRRLGSAALDLVALAEGRLDAYVEEGLKPWDLAAGELIAREAGLIVTGLDGKANERLTIVSHTAVAEDFFDLVVRCGF